jgi:hypothetical protein
LVHAAVAVSDEESAVSDFLSGCAILAGIFAVIVSMIGVPAYFSEKATCKERAEKMQMRRDFGLFLGCMVEYQPGKWLPIESIHATEIK